MVARSEIQPSMTRPPWSGFAVADAAAVPVGPGLAVGPPGVQAVATSMVAAKTAIRTRPVRCFAVMCPPLAPFALPTGFGGRVYPATHSAAHAVYTRGGRQPFTFGVAAVRLGVGAPPKPELLPV